jgi:O-antigen ligase
VNFVYLVFLALAWAGIECLIGGTRLLFSLPAYAVLSIGALLTLASLRSKRIPPDAFCVASTLLLGAWILFRSWHSPVEYLALPDRFMMVACLMTYLITAFYLNSTLDQTILIVVLWLIAALEVWVGMVQFLKDPNFMLFGLLRPTTGRPSGMYISPNNYAGFLLAVAVISVSLAIWSRWRIWAKVLAVYVAACCLLGAALSGSRGGYFDAIGSLVCFAFGSVYAIRAFAPRYFMRVAIAALVGVLAVLALAAFLMSHSQLLTHRMQTMMVRDVRIYNWEAAIDHIKVSPWIGTGSGTHLIYGRLFRRPQIQADPVHAHCDYLELVAEYGTVGAVCMALFLAAHIRRGLVSYSEILRRRIMPSGFHRSNSFAIQLGALCAVAGLAIHSVVDFDMHVPGSAMIFAFIFGILANPGMERRLGFADRWLTPSARLLAPALGLFMLWRGLPLLPSEYCAEKSRTALRDHNLLESIRYAQAGIITSGSDTASTAAGLQLPDFVKKSLGKTGGNPNNPNLYFYMGQANSTLGLTFQNPYLKRMYLDRAAGAFEEGLKVFPQDEKMLIWYGQTLDGLRKFNEAEAIYKRALALDPKLVQIQTCYEAHLVAEGRKDEADALARQWSQVTPPLDADHAGDTSLIR